MNRRLVWLPNLFTSLTLVCGFYSMTLALDGAISAALHAIMAAMIFDFLDGWVARRTNTVTDFGKEYDSLCDMVAFGLAPAITVYQLLTWDSVLSWLIPAIYSCAVAMRLARFNAKESSSAEFEGLPCTAGGPFLVLLCHFLHTKAVPVSALLATVTLTVGVLMNSKIPYRSLKKKRYLSRLIKSTLLLAIAVLVIIAPLKTLFMVLLSYILSPLLLLKGIMRERRSKLLEHN